MRELEGLLALVIAAVVLAAVARRVGAPYPVFLALGGALLTFLPGTPSLTVPPELALAIFVAPVLLDAAYDASPRDLRDNWLPLFGLVVFAVGLTTVAVAMVVRALVPAMSWAPAIALGAIVAPPDAAAATAVLRHVRPPQRLLTILEGESLLNDASALLIYRLAVGAVATNSFSIGAVAPAFLLAVAGSVVVGPALGWLFLRIVERVQHVPTAIILQFVSTFGVWMLADRLGLSGVLTMVCYAITVARTSPERTPARIRIPTYAVWETVIFALNILAFIFIGLQIRPILETLNATDRGRYFTVAVAVLLTVIVVRLAWHMSFNAVVQVARPTVRFSATTADAAADHRERPGDFVGGNARHRLSGCGAGPAAGIPLSRPDRPHRVFCRGRDARASRIDAQAPLTRARLARR
jgi:NhaP-type Na+/H+ or K+/H+ antiporter